MVCKVSQRRCKLISLRGNFAPDHNFPVNFATTITAFAKTHSLCTALCLGNSGGPASFSEYEIMGTVGQSATPHCSRGNQKGSNTSCHVCILTMVRGFSGNSRKSSMSFKASTLEANFCMPYLIRKFDGIYAINLKFLWIRGLELIRIFATSKLQ